MIHPIQCVGGSNDGRIVTINTDLKFFELIVDSFEEIAPFDYRSTESCELTFEKEIYYIHKVCKGFNVSYFARHQSLSVEEFTRKLY